MLFRTPYGRSGYDTDALRPQQCVEAGFAAIVQDMRGRFDSEGAWEPLNWAVEAEDSYDTVEWVAAQEWCSGAVGMSGVSYCGTVQLAASQLKPPHLRAIAPMMASSPEFDRAESGGALRLDLAVSWLAVTSLDWMMRLGPGGLDPQSSVLILKAVQDPRFLYATRPLRSIPLFDIPGFPITFDEFSARLNTPVHPDGIDLAIPGAAHRRLVRPQPLDRGQPVPPAGGIRQSGQSSGHGPVDPLQPAAAEPGPAELRRDGIGGRVAPAECSCWTSSVGTWRASRFSCRGSSTSS